MSKYAEGLAAPNFDLSKNHLIERFDLLLEKLRDIVCKVTEQPISLYSCIRQIHLSYLNWRSRNQNGENVGNSEYIFGPSTTAATDCFNEDSIKVDRSLTKINDFNGVTVENQQVCAGVNQFSDGSSELKIYGNKSPEEKPRSECSGCSVCHSECGTHKGFFDLGKKQIFSIVLMILLLCIPDVSTADFSTIIGHSTTMRCPFNTTREVIWRHLPTGYRIQLVVYTKAIGFARYYEKHSFLDGTYDLHIASATAYDAGKYTCSEIDAEETERLSISMELIVLKSLPMCSSNVNLKEVLGENDCNLNPDYIQHKCEVEFHGNIMPSLEWMNSAGVHVINTTDVTVTTESGWTSRRSVLTMQASTKLNGTHYVCQVKSTLYSRKIICSTNIIEFIYFNRTFEKSTSQYSDHGTSVTCPTQHTPSQCAYKWTIMTNRGKNFIEIRSPTIHTAGLDPGNYSCIVHCTIRNTPCVLNPAILEVIEMTVDSSESSSFWSLFVVTNVAWGVVSFAVVIVLFAILCRGRKCDTCSDLRKDTQHRRAGYKDGFSEH